MNKLDKYMNDPCIANEPQSGASVPLPLREVHAVRLMIYDETKDMTPGGVREYYQKKFDDARKRHNFDVVSSAN